MSHLLKVHDHQDPLAAAQVLIYGKRIGLLISINILSKGLLCSLDWFLHQIGIGVGDSKYNSNLSHRTSSGNTGASISLKNPPCLAGHTGLEPQHLRL